MQKILKLKLIYCGLVIFAVSLLYLPTVKAQVPDEYKNCIPVVTNFKVTPTTLPKKDTQVNISVTVRTQACIIDGNTNWYVYAEMLDQNGNYFKGSDGDILGIPLPTSGKFRPSDFKRVNNDPQNSNYNKYDTTYSVSGPGFSQSPAGSFFTVRPNLYFGNFKYTENTAFAVRITTPGGGPTNTPPIIVPPGNTNQPGSSTVVPGKITDPFGGKTLLGVGTQLINILLALIVIAAVVVIVVAGFRMVTGGGNPDQITKAKKTIIWAIIGLLVAFMSFGIIQIIQTAVQK